MMGMYPSGPPPNNPLSSSSNVYGGRDSLFHCFHLLYSFRKYNEPCKHAHFEHRSGHATALSTASLPLRFYSPPALYNSTHSATAANQFPQQSSAWIGGVRFDESHRWVSSDPVGIKVNISFGLLNISCLSGSSSNIWEKYEIWWITRSIK